MLLIMLAAELLSSVGKEKTWNIHVPKRYRSTVIKTLDLQRSFFFLRSIIALYRYTIASPLLNFILYTVNINNVDQSLENILYDWWKWGNSENYSIPYYLRSRYNYYCSSGLFYILENKTKVIFPWNPIIRITNTLIGPSFDKYVNYVQIRCKNNFLFAAMDNAQLWLQSVQKFSARVI